jgi:hypothetical protein
MAYSHKVAVCIIGEDGQIYNDDPSGRCKIPFGEYKIKVINKNDRRIGFDVLIGGEKVTKAGKIVLSPHKSIELERWLDCESCGDKLKFVPAGSSEAKAAGKTGEFEGEIEVRVYLEKKPDKVEKIVEEHHHHHYDWNDHWNKPYGPIWWTTTTQSNTPTNDGFSTYTSSRGSCASPRSMEFGASVNEVKCCSSQPVLFSNLSEGATVKGSHSNQSFTSTHVNLEEDYISIKMYLLGFTKEKQMEFAFTKEEMSKIEKDIKFCGNCGTEAKPFTHYCCNCGKKLNIYK